MSHEHPITPCGELLSESECQAREALGELVRVIEAAGLHNLTRGVELGPIVWYVKASDAMARAHAALAAGIDTGDHVRHAPSGEDWLVAYVSHGGLVACGWPESMARLYDCTLTKKATPEERRALLVSMSTTGGSRGEYARAQLAAKQTKSGQQGRMQVAGASGSDDPKVLGHPARGPAGCQKGSEQ